MKLINDLYICDNPIDPHSLTVDRYIPIMSLEAVALLLEWDGRVLFRRDFHVFTLEKTVFNAHFRPQKVYFNAKDTVFLDTVTLPKYTLVYKIRNLEVENRTFYHENNPYWLDLPSFHAYFEPFELTYRDKVLYGVLVGKGVMHVYNPLTGELHENVDAGSELWHVHHAVTQMLSQDDWDKLKKPLKQEKGR